MEVKANSLNFWISGYHTFNNEYDYRIKLYLSDIIRLRNKTYEKDLPIVEIDDSTHKSMVYIKYYGKDGQSSISYDSKSALKSFSSKLNEEKQNIKNIFVPKNNSEYKSYDNNKKPKLNFEESKDNKQNEDTKKPKKQEKRQKIEWQDE